MLITKTAVSLKKVRGTNKIPRVNVNEIAIALVMRALRETALGRRREAVITLEVRDVVVLTDRAMWPRGRQRGHVVPMHLEFRNIILLLHRSMDAISEN